EDTPEAILSQLLESRYTRLPVYKDEPENIVGVLHAKDLLRAMDRLTRGPDASEEAMKSFKVLDVAMQPYFVPETTTLDDQMRQFMRRHTHFALVIDEYGSLQGLITLEDILEEIVGDIRDEHDVLVQGVRPQPDGSVNVDGWATIRDINRATGWNLPDEEAVTVAGLVIHEAQTIPDPGQSFVFHGHRFDVLRRMRNQVTGLKVRPVEDVDEASEDRPTAN
ncbi:MAG: CBS domain-containing protein, partial [Pseudomonadota bacterium]